MRLQAERWRREAAAQEPRVAQALREAADLLEDQATLIDKARALSGA